MAPRDTPPIDETHLRLLKEIEQRPNATQRALAQSLGVSLGKANYCVRALVDKGWVKARNFRDNPHKFDYVHLLTPAGIDAKARLTAHFLQRKIAEYDALRAEIEQLKREAVAAD